MAEQPMSEHGDTPAITMFDYVGFVLRAARRHVFLCVVTTLVVGALGAAVATYVPALYASSVKIYLQPTLSVTGTLAGGRRPVEIEVVRGLGEAILNRDNLLRLMREAKLLERWQNSRSWPLVQKDKLLAAAFGPPTLKEQERAVLGSLETWVSANTENQGSIRFTVQWRDPEGAFLLASLVQRNFFTDWQAEEQSAISRAVSLLEDEIKRTDEEIPGAIKAVQNIQAEVRARAAKNAAAAAVVPAAIQQTRIVRVPAAPPAAVRPPVEIIEKLEEIRRGQRAIVEPWQRHIADSKFQLAELRATLGPEHPVVRQQEAKVRGVSEEPIELTRLKEQEHALVASLTAVTTQGAALGAGATTERRITTTTPGRETPSVSSAFGLDALLDRGQDDPAVASLRINLENLLGRSRELQERLDAARLELATSQVGFKYRYKIIEPPEVPRKADKPNRPKLYAISLGLALMLGLLAGALYELGSGRVLEKWQVQSLGLPILGEVELRKARVRT